MKGHQRNSPLKISKNKREYWAETKTHRDTNFIILHLVLKLCYERNELNLFTSKNSSMKLYLILFILFSFNIECCAKNAETIYPSHKKVAQL
jgi:hypothetical protein